MIKSHCRLISRAERICTKFAVGNIRTPLRAYTAKTAVTQSRRTVGAEVTAEYPDFFVTTVEQLFCRRPAAVIVVNADGGKVFKAKLLSVCRTQYTGQFYPCKAPFEVSHIAAEKYHPGRS